MTCKKGCVPCKKANTLAIEIHYLIKNYSTESDLGDHCFHHGLLNLLVASNVVRTLFLTRSSLNNWDSSMREEKLDGLLNIIKGTVLDDYDDAHRD